jgi:outer membrane protein
MKSSTAARVLAGAALIGSLACAGVSNAQTAAAPSSQPLGGPVINGLCILDNNRMVTQSSVGKAVAARLKALSTQVSGELTPQRTALQTEGQALSTQKVPPNDPRVAAFQTKAANFERLLQTREREMQMTQQKALGRIGTEADSVVRAVYAQKNCGILFDRGSLFGANPQMDITDQVIAGLNAKITTFNFDRERLPAQQPTAAVAPKK